MTSTVVRPVLKGLVLKHPDATNEQLTTLLDKALSRNSGPEFEQFRREQYFKALKQYVAQARKDILAELGPKTTYQGRPMAAGLTVRTDSGAQGKLWIDCSPQEFIEAVRREQNIIDGRSFSNVARLRLVELLLTREDLVTFPTLGAVLDELGIDADELALDEIEVPRGA